MRYILLHEHIICDMQHDASSDCLHYAFFKTNTNVSNYYGSRLKTKHYITQQPQTLSRTTNITTLISLKEYRTVQHGIDELPILIIRRNVSAPNEPVNITKNIEHSISRRRK